MEKTYKIIVTTELSDDEFESEADKFLRGTSAKKRIDLVLEMDEKEIEEEYRSGIKTLEDEPDR